MDAYLERIDSEANCMRFYRLELFCNLFGDWQLDREWGRIGRVGKVVSTIHSSGEDALNCAHAILAHKVGRGYEVRSLNWERSNVIGFVPLTERGILNLKLCAYFSGHRVFQDMALRMYRHNILYMGEFIQLSSEDVSLFLPKNRGRTSKFFDELQERLEELSEILGECNLSLGSQVVGWRRPDNEAVVPLLVGQNLRRRRRPLDPRPVATVYRTKFGVGEDLDERSTRLFG